MNGYSLKDFGDFTKDWNLVSVRFRKDSGEMRYTYANKKAWTALNSESVDYQNGSIFGKVSYVTYQDEDFPSSFIPSRPSRVQFMVKNKGLYKKTGGWGFAIFKPNGDLMPGDMNEKIDSCFACHSLVEHRNFVFSRRQNNNLPEENSPSKLKFKKEEIKDLPSHIRELIPSKEKSLFSLQGKLRSHLFYGTLDEIRPALIKKSLKESAPAILLGIKRKKFSLVLRDINENRCAKNEVPFLSYHSGPSPKNKIIKLKFCQAKI